MSIKVAVHSRPLSANEVRDAANIIVAMDGNEVSVAGTHGAPPRKFLYDHVLWFSGLAVEGNASPPATQASVYDAIGAEILGHALTGYNGCIFAYGQTGSGKTYSMMGSAEEPGIVPRLAENLFTEAERLRQAGIEACVEVSYCEIYCEKVRCLLRPTAGGFENSSLRVREHPKYGPFIEGLAKFVVNSQQEFLQLMNDGNKVRSTASTAMNLTSSRSHAVFAITLTQKRKSGKFFTTTTSKLNLVDLAGSERVSKTHATGKRLTESANINQSLASLGNVISALAEMEETGKARHIPYRDSVLTWILKDNLGGNSKTIMLAAISPSSDQIEETVSTLRYAERAKNIMNKAVVNESNNNEVITALQKEIENLKSQLGSASSAERERLLEELAASEAVQRDLSTSLEEKLADTKRMMAERERYMRELESKLVAQNAQIESLKRINDEKEQQIADLLGRINTLAAHQPTTPAPESPQQQQQATGAKPPSPAVGVQARADEASLEQMREQVAALEHEQNVAETEIESKRRTADLDDIDDELSILMAADPIPTATSAPLAAGGGVAAAGGFAAAGGLRRPASMIVDAETHSDQLPVALQQGFRRMDAEAAQGMIDLDLESLDGFDKGSGDGGDVTASEAASKDPADDAGEAFEVDSDLTLGSSMLGDSDLEIDADLVIDDDGAEDGVVEAGGTSTHPVSQSGPSGPPLSSVVSSTDQSSVSVQRVGLYNQMHGSQPVRIEQLQPGGEYSVVAHQQRQDQERALATAEALQTWNKSEARPEIFAPSQNVVQLVVPSHALPNNRYLHESFRVVKMKETGLLRHRKDRVWDIDFFAHTFGNYDTNGSKSFSLPSSHLFRVEKDLCNPMRLTLYFFEAPHPYDLEFTSASRRRRFYELAMLQRRNSILWCPSLCLDKENDVAITVRGTTIERPNRILPVCGEAKFTVARMPYEVIDFWYGCLSLQNSAPPRNTAVLGSFLPKAAHDIYVIGLADVPSSLLGTDDVGQYFVNYLGSADYYTFGTTTMDNNKRRGTYNSILLICRRSFIVRISHVQLMEAPTVHRKGVGRGDFSGVACAFTVNEATVCAILVNAKQTRCDTPTRNACIRALINSFPFGDASIDIAARFDYLIVSGAFGYSGGGAPFTAEDPLLQQLKLNNLMSNMAESEPSPTLKLIRDPMRVFFAVRPRVSRMDVALYNTSRALAAPNAYVMADLFSQRSYLSVFGESVPRTQLIFDRLTIAGERLPELVNTKIEIRGSFFEGAPLVALALTDAGKRYSAAANAVPILCPVVSNAEFLRLQTVHVALVGSTTTSKHGKPTTIASGVLPLKSVLSLGEAQEFAVPLYYQSCLVGVLQGSLLHIYYEKNYADVVEAGLVRERFVCSVGCYENQVRQSGGGGSRRRRSRPSATSRTRTRPARSAGRPLCCPTPAPGAGSPSGATTAARTTRTAGSTGTAARGHRRSRRRRLRRSGAGAGHGRCRRRTP